MKKNETTGKAPVHRMSVGAVSCSVFLNKSKEGVEFPSAVISRNYKAGETFKTANSYGVKHLAQLSQLVAGVQTYLKENFPES